MPWYRECIEGVVLAFLFGYTFVTERNIEILKLNFDAKIREIMSKHSEDLRQMEYHRAETKAEMENLLLRLSINFTQEIHDLADRFSSLRFNVTENAHEINSRLGDLYSSYEKRVAFYVYFSKNVPISSLIPQGTFVYDSVEINIGNGYDRNTGHFTVPHNGVYVFHVTTVSVDLSWSTVQLMVNGAMKDVGFADSGQHTDRASASTLTIMTLNKGDIVYTRNHYKGGNYLESNEHSRLSFSGYKIY